MRRGLIVHSAQSATLAIEGDVALNQIGVKAMRCEFPGTESTGEKAPIVGDYFGRDEVSSVKDSLGEFHRLAELRGKLFELIIR